MRIYPISHCWTQVLTVLWFLPVSVSLTCLMFGVASRDFSRTWTLTDAGLIYRTKRKENQISCRFYTCMRAPSSLPSTSLRTSRPMRTFFLLESHPHPGLRGGRAAINLHLLSHSSPPSGFHVFPFPSFFSLHLSTNLTSALLFLHHTTLSFFSFFFSYSHQRKPPVMDRLTDWCPGQHLMLCVHWGGWVGAWGAMWEYLTHSKCNR